MARALVNPQWVVKTVNMKRMLSIIAVIIGILLALLGALWFLQGTGLVVIEPIFCVTDCEPVTGANSQWTIMGATAFLIGSLLSGFFARRMFRNAP